MRNWLDKLKPFIGRINALSPFDKLCLIVSIIYVVIIVGAVLLHITHHTSQAVSAPVFPTPRDYQVYKLVNTEEEYGHTYY